jgi:hypothetical protein
MSNEAAHAAGSPEIDKSLAEEVRDACVEAAIAAYEDAGVQGLCDEGRFEAAISAMRSVDITAVIHNRFRSNIPQQ